MKRLAAWLVALVVGLSIGLGLYLAAVWLSFRWLGNRDELTPAHRRLLDREAW